MLLNFTNMVTHPSSGSHAYSSEWEGSFALPTDRKFTSPKISATPRKLGWASPAHCIVDGLCCPLEGLCPLLSAFDRPEVEGCAPYKWGRFATKRKGGAPRPVVDAVLSTGRMASPPNKFISVRYVAF